VERDQYELMFRQEERHWWYVGMRRIAEALLGRYFRPSSARPEVLDAGCGSGGTTAWLGRWGRVTGIDLMPEAIALARRRGLKRLARASIQALPFVSERFDLVTCFDVLYHLKVDDDLAAVREFRRVLRPGGMVLIRVAAHERLRGAHDEAVHTRHRYRRGELAAKLRAAGFVVEHTSYANGLLLPIAPLKWALERRGNGGAVDLWRPPGPLNSVLAGILGLEAPLVARAGLPVGVSLLAVARRA
jgi:SAM-dependent methyltransferase